MTRPDREIFDRLGTRGLVRVLEDLLDQGHIVRLANACGLRYPGMRTQSQKRSRIVAWTYLDPERREAWRMRKWMAPLEVPAPPHAASKMPSPRAPKPFRKPRRT